MKPFTKPEIISLVVIFFILIAVSVPNFALSLRRARDQVRRDDMGAMEKALAEYQRDFGIFPGNSPDGKILACKRPEDKVTVGPKGQLIVKLIPCEWGRDGWRDLTPGSTKVYMSTMPADPDIAKGMTYRYYSDGDRYQMYVAFEGKDEAEYDKKIIARGISCGGTVCNVGRAFNCDKYKTIEEYDLEHGYIKK